MYLLQINSANLFPISGSVSIYLLNQITQLYIPRSVHAKRHRILGTETLCVEKIVVFIVVIMIIITIT